MKTFRSNLIALVILLFCSTSSFAANEMEAKVLQLQQRWAQINYQMEGEKQQSAFEALINDAGEASKQFPDSAPIWIWNGIIKSTYAGVKGGLGALKLAKQSKADLEHAIEINPDAMLGSAYTSLGALYANVPGWPIGFGDDEKAEQYLLRAVTLDPTGIDSNYFYADYLRNEKRYQEAKDYLIKAQSAPKRENRPLADAGRQKEIRQALLAVDKKLNLSR